MFVLLLIIIIIFFLFMILLSKIPITKNAPIIKQTRTLTDNKIDNIKEYITKRPYYSKLPPEYTNTDFMGQTYMKGDIVHEQIAEEICPMGTFIKKLEIGDDGENINYIKGFCSGFFYDKNKDKDKDKEKNKKELETLGKNISKNKKEIEEDNGFEKLNVKYDDTFIKSIAKIGGGQLSNVGKNIICPNNNIIVGYRGRAEDKIKHLQFICGDKNAKKDIPLTHVKCGNDGQVCHFDRNDEYIYYGIPGRKVVEIDKNKILSNKFTCYPEGFFGINGAPVLPIEDPLPGENKSCYIEKKNYKLEEELLEKERKIPYRY
jgi:hypothetical protein